MASPSGQIHSGLLPESARDKKGKARVVERIWGSPFGRLLLVSIVGDKIKRNGRILTIVLERLPLWQASRRKGFGLEESCSRSMYKIGDVLDRTRRSLGVAVSRSGMARVERPGCFKSGGK